MAPGPGGFNGPGLSGGAHRLLAASVQAGSGGGGAGGVMQYGNGGYNPMQGGQPMAGGSVENYRFPA